MKCIAVLLVTALAASSAGATGELDPAAEAAAAQTPGGAAAEAPEASEVPEEAAAESSAGSVARAAFTTSVVDREPVDAVEQLTSDRGRVTFFSELIGLQDQTVSHRWEYGGEVRAEVPFEVGGPRWRVHSSKRLLPDWLGTWTVTVVDGAGRELARHQLEVLPAAPAAPAPGETVP